jgi:uncharacterized Zn finger protein
MSSADPPVPAVDRRESNCPQCGQQRGLPQQVRMQHSLRCLTLKCGSCGTEWSITHALRPERTRTRDLAMGKRVTE